MRGKNTFRHTRINNPPLPLSVSWGAVGGCALLKQERQRQVLGKGVNIGKRQKEIPGWPLYSRPREGQCRLKEGVLQGSVSSETDRVYHVFDYVENSLGIFTFLLECLE